MSRRKPTKVQQWFSEKIAEEMFYLRIPDRWLNNMIKHNAHEAAEAEQRYIDDVLDLADKMRKP